MWLGFVEPHETRNEVCRVALHFATCSLGGSGIAVTVACCRRLTAVGDAEETVHGTVLSQQARWRNYTSPSWKVFEDLTVLDETYLCLSVPNGRVIGNLLCSLSRPITKLDQINLNGKAYYRSLTGRTDKARPIRHLYPAGMPCRWWVRGRAEEDCRGAQKAVPWFPVYQSSQLLLHHVLSKHPPSSLTTPPSSSHFAPYRC